ncbi:MAG TPA: ROK family protein [Candidatus Saccharimonadales bacterium]
MIIGVDIGGTKTLVASFTGDAILAEARFATPSEPADFFTDLVPQIQQLTRGQRLQAISVAAPGIVDHHRGSIVRCGNLPWKNIELRQELGHFFDCPIYLENDANLAGLAEAHALNPLPRLCLYLTISTGIGSGIVVNGRLLPALGGSEAGHMLLQHNGAGGLAQWEHFASGRSLRERTGKFASQINDKKVWKDFAERVGVGLLALIPALQPSVVVIGGGVGAYFETRWQGELEAYLHENMPPFIDVPPILQAQHPDEAVLYGCRYYARQHDID